MGEQVARGEHMDQAQSYLLLAPGLFKAKGRSEVMCGFKYHPFLAWLCYKSSGGFQAKK